MDISPDDRSPAFCLPLGLECRSCVQRSAGTVAAICHGMTPEGVEKIFGQIFPSAGCAQMSVTFESAYFDAAAPRKSVVRSIVAA